MVKLTLERNSFPIFLFGCEFVPPLIIAINLENWEFLGGVLFKLSTPRSIHIKHLTLIYFSVHFFLLIKSIKDLPPSTGLHFSCVIHIMTVRVYHMQRCLCCDHDMNINISCFSFGWKRSTFSSPSPWEDRFRGQAVRPLNCSGRSIKKKLTLNKSKYKLKVFLKIN